MGSYPPSFLQKKHIIAALQSSINQTELTNMFVPLPKSVGSASYYVRTTVIIADLCVKSIANLFCRARGAMVWWLKQLLVKQDDLGSIPAHPKCFSSLLGYKEVGIK